MVHLSTYLLLASVYPNLFSVYPLSVQPSLTYGDPHMHTVFLMHAGYRYQKMGLDHFFPFIGVRSGTVGISTFPLPFSSVANKTPSTQ